MSLDAIGSTALTLVGLRAFEIVSSIALTETDVMPWRTRCSVNSGRLDAAQRIRLAIVPARDHERDTEADELCAKLEREIGRSGRASMANHAGWTEVMRRCSAGRDQGRTRTPSRTSSVG